MRPSVVRTTAAMRPAAATPLRVRVGPVGVTRNVRRVAPVRARSVTVQAMADEKDQGGLVADSEVAISKVAVAPGPRRFVAAYPTPTGRACLSLPRALVVLLLEASNPRRREDFRPPRHGLSPLVPIWASASWHPASAVHPYGIHG